ncbi:bifunctional diaminohydroxyphosphoribosylaminopyrimidine deaminase/5-amino-6-(5-phosphoribosylamino)uracil reductase RibD [Dehalogenimonas formicexedens]|nr:bifunctional diaminohydroxyphosphoribosylaminopyrimidine deaminase/5-amino-6-(5-phosphoribosylamino)uracil reductase RibD [Dehalogenimonas formicexedens]
MDYMEQALKLARLALGEVSPNPAVGAVIVRGDEIVGEGFTQPPGQDHAEIVALKQAGEQSHGATMYVTLEPCCHFGRTPPCTRAIIAAGIKAVHIATLDDNPRVFGCGKAELESAGIEVHIGERREEARELNEAYFKYINTGLPFVTAKYSMSLDGKIATRTMDSKWISNDDSRLFSHTLRHASDAIMAGVGTVLADNPRLTARGCAGRGGTSHKQPMRVIVDSNGRTPLDACVFTEPGKTLIALGRAVPESRLDAYRKVGAEVVQLPGRDGRVGLEPLLRYLGERQITSLLVEGGGTLLGSLFDERLVDKVVAIVAPIIIGGAGAKTPVAGVGVEKIAQALSLENVRVTRSGDDTVISGYVVKE